MDVKSELDERTREHHLRRLIETCTGIVSELDLEAVLHRVVETARDLTGARYAALGVLNRDRSELERFVYVGIEEETRRMIGAFPRGRGVLGELIRNPRPLRLRDVNEHPHAYGFPPGHPPMRSFLGVPITVRGEVYGNLYLTEKRGAEEFDEWDEEAVVILARCAGIAIENARLYTSLAEREAELERALRSAETSLDIATTVGGETDTGRVLDLIVKRARALVEARAVAVLLRRGDDLEVAASAGALKEDLAGHRIPIAGSIHEAVLGDQRPRRLDDEALIRQTAPLAAHVGAQAELIVPLVFRSSAVGTLIAFDREGGPQFDQEDLRLLQAFAASAATAVATAQTVESDRLKQQVAVSERERRHWARELHDETLQALAAIRITLAAALQDDGPRRAESIERAASDAIEQLEGQITELTRLINDLRPISLEQAGLPEALRRLAQESAAHGELEVEADVEIDSELGADAQRVAYRLVQESLSNVIRHARAKRAVVRARLGEGYLRIAVEDDGNGFDTGSVAPGHGLIGMRERVEMLGGDLAISSNPGQGTAVTARIPTRRG